jgi:hypothetical protein
MKRHLFLTLAVAGMFSWAGLAFSRAAHDHGHEKNAFTPDTIPWGPAPPVVRPGAQFAVLEGDPTASTGDFTIRLKSLMGSASRPTSIRTGKTSRSFPGRSNSAWVTSLNPIR